MECRFPQADKVNGKGKAGRGIGSHTDYGLLVIAGQDDVGGLFIRPPTLGEEIKNWEKSAAGLNEDDDKWHYIMPADGVLTVFPGLSLPFSSHAFSNIQILPYSKLLYILTYLNRGYDAIPHLILSTLHAT